MTLSVLSWDAASNHFLCSKMRFKKNDSEADLAFQISHLPPLPSQTGGCNMNEIKISLITNKKGGADLDSLCLSEGSDGKSLKPVIWSCSTFRSKFVAIKSSFLGRLLLVG